MTNRHIKNIVIKYLIKEYNKSNTNIVKIGVDDIKNMKLKESQVSRMLYTLDSSDLINIKRSSKDNTFTMYWELQILLPCIEYFGKRRLEFGKFIVPVFISIIGAVAAILTAYFTALMI